MKRMKTKKKIKKKKNEKKRIKQKIGNLVLNKKYTYNKVKVKTCPENLKVYRY